MKRSVALLLLALVTAAAVAMVAVPVWLLQPFAPQTDSAVQWSQWLRRLSPMLTAVAAVLVLWLAATAWRRPRVDPPGSAAAPRPNRVRLAAARATVVLCLAATAGAAWFARQNHFEWMFRPFPNAAFLAAADARDVPAEEPVIGVAAGGAALAFPITRIGYHHLVNTTLGDVPIVATY